MTTKFQKTAAKVLAVATVLTMGTVTAFAATTNDSTAAETSATYGYLTGQQRNSDRHTLYEAVPTFTTDAEREAYFEANGIGGDGPYSAAQHLDAEALVASGIIDQATADKIAAYGSTKHDAIHGRYEGKSEMTPDQRQAMYESAEADGFDGDSVSELLNVGVITQEQADEINSYLSR
ncbi:MAG: hypothetical protein ACRDBO_17085 [Lachnospiraceae bacterium]